MKRKRIFRLFLVMTVLAIIASLTLVPTIALAAPASFMDGAEPAQDFNLLQVLYTTGVLAAVLGVVYSALTFVKAWFDSKTKLIKDDRGRAALQQVNDAVFSAVLQTAQLEADAFKAAAADGKLTETEKAELKRLAYDRAVSFISGDIWDVARRQVEDLDEYINAQIEKYVRLDKAGGTAAAK